MRSWPSELLVMIHAHIFSLVLGSRILQAGMRAVSVPYPPSPGISVTISEAGFPGRDENDLISVHEIYAILLSDMKVEEHAGRSDDSPLLLSEFQHYISSHSRHPEIITGGSATPEAWENIYNVFVQYSSMEGMENPSEAARPTPAISIDQAGSATQVPWVFEGDSMSALVRGESSAEECLDTAAVRLNPPTLNVPRTQICLTTVAALRFTGLPIHRGSEIHAASLHFTAGTSTGAVSLEIVGEATDDASTLQAVQGNLDARAKTRAACQWHMAQDDEWASGSHQTSPDLSTVFSELVARPGWIAGNSIVLLIWPHRFMESLMGALSTASESVSDSSNHPRYRAFVGVEGMSLQLSWRSPNSSKSSMAYLYATETQAKGDGNVGASVGLGRLMLLAIVACGFGMCCRTARQYRKRHGKHTYQRVSMQGIELDTTLGEEAI